MKKRLIISFSGGRTSAYMTWWLLNEWPERDEWEIIVVFANTGLEDEGTLFFVDECAQEWNIPIVWVEYVPVQSKRGKWWGARCKVVTYETASRKGEPFEALISKLGIPSSKSPFCSPQLKRETIKAYARSIKFTKFHVAIGIRADEPGRVKRNNKKQKLLYPLVDLNPMGKMDILIWWKQQSFDLDIHVDDGNCKRCWKKNILTLTRGAIRQPESFDWWQEMTDKYGHIYTGKANVKPPFNFYRGNLSPKDIFRLSKLPVDQIRKMASREKLDGCQESCEAF